MLTQDFTEFCQLIPQSSMRIKVKALVEKYLKAGQNLSDEPKVYVNIHPNNNQLHHTCLLNVPIQVFVSSNIILLHFLCTLSITCRKVTAPSLQQPQNNCILACKYCMIVFKMSKSSALRLMLILKRSSPNQGSTVPHEVEEPLARR